MKYYVVSETELESLASACYADGAEEIRTGLNPGVGETHLIACRVRPVGRTTAGLLPNMWVEKPKDRSGKKRHEK